MVEILDRDNPILRKKAELVSIDDIGTPKIAKIIADMAKAMQAQKDGIAIAAPQIGVSLQIFLVSGSLLQKADPTYTGPAENIVFINPKITRRSKEMKEMEEGCLSVRWYYGIVKRHQKVTLTAIDEKGQKIERGASGLLAQIFQHETDHLNGILFIDRASEIWEMSQEEIAEITKGKN
jgi:peptide deformylase